MKIVLYKIIIIIVYEIILFIHRVQRVLYTSLVKMPKHEKSQSYHHSSYIFYHWRGENIYLFKHGEGYTDESQFRDVYERSEHLSTFVSVNVCWLSAVNDDRLVVVIT